MTNQQLQQELRARKEYNFGKTKADLIQSLKSTLRGAQRVPSLLLLNPTQMLSDMNLDHYTILDCEPLHDLKGHIQNIFDELPKLLNKTLSVEVKAVLDTDLGKDMKTGGDYRLASIHLLALLQKRTPQHEILHLIQTLVEISEIFYADDSKRSPRSVLRLYNLTWVHFQLCCKLFQRTNNVSHQKMFGIYMHALTMHAPPQYEIVCMKSTNSEHEERLFGQAKNMVHMATNRKPTTVIPNVLLRLQARQKRGDLYKAHNDSSSKISRNFREMKFTKLNTTITHDFISRCTASWQAHLTRISLFLLPGKGVWWKNTQDGYEFMDGSEEPNCHAEGPPLCHFRNTSLEDVYLEKQKVFQHIIDENVEVPAPFLRIYGSDGMCTEERTFGESQILMEQGEEQQQPQEKTQEGREVNMNEEEKEHEASMHGEKESEHKEDGSEQEEQRTDQQEHEQIIDTECIVQISDEDTHEEMQSNQLKTKLCSAILKALGTDVLEDLLVLDTLRHKMKQQSIHLTAQCVSRYKQLVARYREELIKEGRLKASIRDFESAFYNAHNCLPDVTEVEEYKRLNKSKSFIRKLVQSEEFSR